MKQHITKEQWDELTSEQKSKLQQSHTLPICLGHGGEGTYPGISLMIEFLGDDLQSMYREPKDWWLEPMKKRKPELCDALFEAVKHKLNN